MKKFIYLSLSLLMFCGTAEAQFLKNLKKKVEQKVENTVTENISNKAAKEADKSLNSLWENQMKDAPITMGANRVDPAIIPDNYSFNWEYTLHMKSSQGDMEMTYMLKEDAPYFGFKMPQAADMFMVMDNEKEITVMYLSSGDNKFVTASKIELQAADDEENPYKDMEIEEIGTKTILGYECQGYKGESEDHIFTFYITDEPEISFTNMYHNEKSRVPEGFNTDWFKEEKGIMMEMHMEDKKNDENSLTMLCTGLEEKSFSISKNDYNSLGEN